MKNMMIISNVILFLILILLVIFIFNYNIKMNKNENINIVGRNNVNNNIEEILIKEDEMANSNKWDVLLVFPKSIIEERTYPISILFRESTISNSIFISMKSNYIKTILKDVVIDDDVKFIAEISTMNNNQLIVQKETTKFIQNARNKKMYFSLFAQEANEYYLRIKLSTNGVSIDTRPIKIKVKENHTLKSILNYWQEILAVVATIIASVLGIKATICKFKKKKDEEGDTKQDLDES